MLESMKIESRNKAYHPHPSSYYVLEYENHSTPQI